MSHLVSLLAIWLAAPAPAGELERATLGNGIEVLMLPIPGCERVAVEAFYEVGNLDEPEGMTQSAHLLEHLVCYAGTANHEPHESHDEIARLGMANAETLADFTHYDYVVPPAELARVLQVEAERLGSLEITDALVDEEAPRCYAEVDSVAANPRGGLLKHGLSALAQAWRHGANEAFVRRGLEDYAVADLERFRASCYRPSNLTLVIVGDFHPEAALELGEERLGEVRDDPKIAAIPPIDWSKAARRSSVTWDGPLRIVCVAYPPPEQPLDRLLLAGRGNALLTTLPADPDLAPLVLSIWTSNSFTGVGRLPFYAYAVAAEGADLDVLAETLALEVETAFAAPMGKNELFQLRVMTAQRARQSDSIDMAYVTMSEATLAKQGWQPAATRTQVIGQLAVDLGMAERFFGAERDALLERLNKVKPEDVEALCKRVVAAERRVTTVLVPEAKGR